MTYFAYNALLSLVQPLGRAYLSVRAPLRPLCERFHPSIPEGVGAARPLWVQACSVGEVNTSRPFIQALAERWPERPRVLTVSTVTGHDLACGAPLAAATAWCPFDGRRVVRRFVEGLRPLALVLVETEFWPNLLRETRRAGVPVIVVNGRLSDKHLERYRRYRGLLGPVIRQISAAGMQNEEYAERLVMLGADPARVHVTGNLKFDGATSEVPAARLERLGQEMGLGPEEPVLIFGSTRPGDEALAAECWRVLRERYPSLKLVIAPRHADRLVEALAPFEEPLLRRSEVVAGRPPSGERVIVVDTTGELVAFYALATVAVVGGSFYAGVNGHNPIEPAALGVATVFGPYMRNFVDPARELVSAGGAVQVERPEALLGALERLLDEAGVRQALAERGREAVVANRGATARTVDLIASILDEGS